MTDHPGSIVPEDATAVSLDEAEARAGLVLALRGRGIGDRSLLSAIERLPRRLFLSARYHRLAYEDASIPIECGQTVSAPSYVARVVQALGLTRDHRVLEVGTGSGYQTAVLGHLAGEVDSIDRYKTLVELATQRAAALKLKNVRIHHADGLGGLKERAPFDRIVLTGAVPDVPEVLISQLAPEGILIAPVGEPGKPQALTRILRGAAGDDYQEIDRVRLVSLTQGRADRL
ncbi:protein-L-isoaspartate(D-aspartate) O-methyltransferase [Roseibium aggregatum]|uniref:Protein-L-isoaspartate O-methyltransferase n=1 Tax=Roseibium aggregatum TaxID=187304 RepID=A0A926P3X3_9HYPH|nr:protein-L-isoaspartate(D-aspartate) O-methyltransferase [Roseibium aggregatum]MBD1546302.1 protein-L-isoaspartate(D-aspartate) O-methyltransferase [Roseibium aggregatum]